MVREIIHCDINAQLASKKSWERCTSVLSLLETIISTPPELAPEPGKNDYESNALVIVLSGSHSRVY